MSPTVFRNALIFDGISEDLLPGEILVEDGRIKEVSDTRISVSGANEIDARGRVVMPGLIDLHVHIWFAEMNVTRLARMPTAYTALYAAQFLQSSLDRGFTTLRDAGGTDVGFAMGIEKGFVKSPRFYFSGRYISQTGGHGDFREGFEPDMHDCMCCPPPLARHTVIVDGADAVRRAVREEFRRGAKAIKIMASGGVASPTDPVDQLQFTDAEITAAVEEAATRKSYIFAHCHPDAAIRRCSELGVRCIEHVTMIQPETARLLARNGTYAVPTVAVVKSLTDDGSRFGMPPESIAKLGDQYESILAGLGYMKEAGVKMGFGTDLLAEHNDRQGIEFELRAQVLPAIDVLRSATSIGAEILQESGNLGVVAPGAHADLLVVDGNPLENIGILAQQGRMLPVIMKGGVLHKNLLQ